MFCGKCGAALEDDEKFCVTCGKPVRPARLTPLAEDLEPDPHWRPEDAANTATPIAASDAPATDASPEAYRKAAIGPKNQLFYLNYFAKSDAVNPEWPGASWNWPAFFVTFWWMLYRKLWMGAILYLSASLIIGVALRWVTAPAFLLIMGAAVYLLVPAYANAFYFRHVRRQISNAKAATHDTMAQLRVLSERGGTSNAVLIAGSIWGAIVVIGIVAAIAIPMLDKPPPAIASKPETPPTPKTMRPAQTPPTTSAQALPAEPDLGKGIRGYILADGETPEMIEAAIAACLKQGFVENTDALGDCVNRRPAWQHEVEKYEAKLTGKGRSY